VAQPSIPGPGTYPIFSEKSYALSGQAISELVYSTTDTAKPLRWVGTSRKDLRKFPQEVQADVGYALWLAQQGGRGSKTKPLSGFGSGTGVLEVVERHSGDAYRAVYTIRFFDAIYVLHAFQKEVQAGSEDGPTPHRCDPSPASHGAGSP
jgi:phage-related protein